MKELIFEYDNGTTNTLSIPSLSLPNITGLKVQDLETLHQRTYTPLDTLKHYNDWFLFNNTYYYYKNISIEYELLASIIGKYFHLPMLDYLIVQNNNDYGIMSENFRNENTKYYYGYDLNLSLTTNILHNIQKLEEAFGKSDHLRSKIYALIAFEYALNIIDRTPNNILFYLDTSYHLDLAPIFDCHYFMQYPIFARGTKETAIRQAFAEDQYESFWGVARSIDQDFLSLLHIEEFRYYLSLFLSLDLPRMVTETNNQYHILLNLDKRTYESFTYKQEHIARCLKR